MCERELETEQNCNILTPTLLVIIAFLSRILGCSTGGLGPNLCGCWFSVQHLISNSSDPQTQSGVPRAPSAECCFLYSIISPTLWSPNCALSYIKGQRTPFSCGRHNRTHSTRPRSRLYSDIPWADAPIIYTGALPILTARPGRRSIYNTSLQHWYLNRGKTGCVGNCLFWPVARSKHRSIESRERCVDRCENINWYK